MSPAGGSVSAGGSLVGAGSDGAGMGSDAYVGRVALNTAIPNADASNMFLKVFFFMVEYPLSNVFFILSYGLEIVQYVELVAKDGN